MRAGFVLTSLLVLVSINAYAGTFFDDFEQENDFWVVELGEWTIEEGVYHQTDTTSNGARGLSSHVEGSENWGNDFTIVEQGVVSYWTFDEADIEGNTVKDLRGNNHGTISVDYALSHGFSMVGWHCDNENLGSIGTAEKVGFTKERNYTMYDLLLDEAIQGSCISKPR